MADFLTTRRYFNNGHVPGIGYQPRVRGPGEGGGKRHEYNFGQERIEDKAGINSLRQAVANFLQDYNFENPNSPVNTHDMKPRRYHRKYQQKLIQALHPVELRKSVHEDSERGVRDLQWMRDKESYKSEALFKWIHKSYATS